MRKKIVIGSLPITSAVNSNAAKEITKSQCPIIVPDIDVEELIEQYANDPSEPLPIIVTLLIWLLKITRIILVPIWAILIYFIFLRGNNDTACIIS
jgi:hypothetical protein